MQFRTLPILISALALLIFSSCQEESIQPAQSISFTPEDYLRANVKQSVLFQFEFTNPETGEYRGWFIDNTGTVKSYDPQNVSITNLPGKEYCSPAQLSNLFANAEATHLTLPAEEVVDHFKKISIAAGGQLSARVDNNSDKTLTVFRAFHLIPHQTSQSSCNDTYLNNAPSYPATDSGENYQAVLLKASGAYHQENERAAAKEIVRWLEGIQSAAGL